MCFLPNACSQLLYTAMAPGRLLPLTWDMRNSAGMGVPTAGGVSAAPKTESSGAAAPGMLHCACRFRNSAPQQSPPDRIQCPHRGDGQSAGGWSTCQGRNRTRAGVKETGPAALTHSLVIQFEGTIIFSAMGMSWSGCERFLVTCPLLPLPLPCMTVNKSLHFFAKPVPGCHWSQQAEAPGQGRPPGLCNQGTQPGADRVEKPQPAREAFGQPTACT